MQFKLIIGLGNPDKRYLNTYHNVGFLAVDYLAKNPPISNSQFLISKSTEYMNHSGVFAAKMLKKQNVKPENLLVVHDDSDLKIGAYKLVFGRGAAGHHGVESVQAALKTKNFWRLRIGVRPERKADLPAEAPRAKAGEFVLKKISAGHRKLLERVFEEAAEEIKKSA